jgi:probable HAF family extracellular repeat protein
MLSLLGTLIGRTALFLIFSFLFAAFSNADAVSFTPLENLPSSTSSEANGISPDGSNIVGSSGGQAAVWTDIGAFGLGYLPGYESSQALDIPFFSWSSNIDPIVGTAYSSTGMEQAFRWSKDTGMVGLGFLTGDDRSRAYGISGDRIVIVGTSFNSTDSYKAFRWVRGDGEMVNIGTGIAIGASFHGEVIVGRSNGEAFRWTQSTGIVGLGDLPGGDFYSSATAVSSDGSVVVGFGETSEGRRAFRWTESEGMVDIGNLPGYSEAHAVSSDGSVIVGMVNARQYPF